MRPSAPAVAARPSLSSTTALTASVWKRSTSSAALRASDQRIAVESKLPVTTVCPSGEIASARTGPPWPRNCASAVDVPIDENASTASHAKTENRDFLLLSGMRGNRLVGCCRRQVPGFRPRFSARRGRALARARLVAIKALGLEIVEVVLEPALSVETEIVQERPRIDPGGM